MASGNIKSDGWVYAGARDMHDPQTGTWTVSGVDLTKITESMLILEVGYSPRYSVTIPKSVFGTRIGADFTIGASRLYIFSDISSASTLEVSAVTNGGMTSTTSFRMVLFVKY